MASAKVNSCLLAILYAFLDSQLDGSNKMLSLCLITWPEL